MLACHEPWALCLPRGRALTVPPAAHPRWLAVVAGRVWATRTGERVGEVPPADHWLAEGEHLALPAGSRWVLEGGPEAELALLEAPKAPEPRAQR